MIETTQPTPNGNPPESAAPSAARKAPIAWEKPSISTKLAFAFPYFSSSAMVAPLSVELKIFYTDVLLVPAGMLALVTALARAFDTFTDMIIAYVVDNFKTRWGRRIVWIPIGVPLSVLFYWLMFAVPRGLTDPATIAIWAGVTFYLYYFFHSLWAIPYHALGLELTPDFHDRTQIFAIRSIFGGVGAVISFISLTWLHGQVGSGEWFVDTRQMLYILTGILALQMSFFYILPVIGVKEHPEFSKRKGAPLVPGVRRALRNGPFKIILTAMIIGSIASAIPPLLMPFFSKYVLQLPPHWRSNFALIYVIAGFMSIPIWTWISRKRGKLFVYIVSAIAAGCAGFAFWFVRQGMILIMSALEVVRGFCAGSHTIVGPSMLADIIDYDEFRTGKRREAQFGMFLSLLPKFISIVSATLPLVILGIAGYDPSQGTLPDSAIFAIRSLFSWFPLIFQVAILIVILRYPINQTVHQKIREGVILHQQGKDAVDPITGRTVPPHDMAAVDEDTGWFLDNFSIKELKIIADQGAAGIINQVKRPIVKYGIISLGSIILTIGMLHNAMSMSQIDQLKQGVGTLFIIIIGLSITMMIFHILRIRAAKKMTANTIDADTIRKHLQAI